MPPSSLRVSQIADSEVLRVKLGWSVGILAVVGFALAACSALPSGSVRVQDAWARPRGPAQSGMGADAKPATTPSAMSGMMSTSAAYFTILGSTTPDSLVGVSVDPSVAETAEMHETTVDGGVAQMHPVARVEVPAGGRVEFKPGGYHVMLINLKRDLKPGDRLTLKLAFEKAGSVSVDAEVRSP